MVIAVTKYEPSHFLYGWKCGYFFCKSDRMADFGSDFCWEWELLLGVVKGHVK